MSEGMNKTTKWHTPIYRGLQLDLRGNNLEFQDEIQLSEEALIIDAVVIKKNDDVQIKKRLCRLPCQTTRNTVEHC